MSTSGSLMLWRRPPRCYVLPGVLAAAYLVFAQVSFGVIGTDVLDLAALPLAATAGLLGLRVGIAAAVGASAVNAALGASFGMPLAERFSAAHVVVFAALAVSFGLLGDLTAALQRERDALRGESGARQAADERLRMLLANAPMALVAIDARGRYILREGLYLDVVGVSRSGALIGEDAIALIREHFPEEPRAATNFERALRGDAFSEILSMRGRKIRHEYRPVRDASGAVAQVVCVLTDVTALDDAQTEIRRAEARLEAIVANATEAVITVDAHGSIVLFNAAAERIFGRSAGEMLGMPIDPLIPAAVRGEHAGRARTFFSEGGNGHRMGTNINAVRANGEEFPVEATLSRIEVGGEVLVTAIVRDVSERMQQEAELSRLALWDTLTELPNRNLFRDRLAHALADAARRHESVALLLIDLDRFRDVNDTFGHSTGDALLRLVGPRLAEELRQNDTVARLGGDEFAVLLPAAGESGALSVARKLHTLLELPFDVDGHVVAIGASIGVAVAPAHGDDVETVLRRADIAMYHAKDAGSAVILYAPSPDEDASTRLALTAELRRALDRDELELYYQPIVRTTDGAPCALEALLRWRHRERGPIPPAEFIPLAERTGLMPALTEWVLSHALGQAAAWRENGVELPVSVNLSARSLADPELPATVASHLTRHGLPSAALRLEITESVVMADPDRAMTVLVGLREMGLHLDIDDFGTGYSSLAYLQRLPVATVKIDRSFVTQMRTNEASAAIVRSTIELAHSLELQVVAEGVEDEATWQALADLGCDSIQGYGVCRPVPPVALEEWMASAPQARRPRAAARPS